MTTALWRSCNYDRRVVVVTASPLRARGRARQAGATVSTSGRVVTTTQWRSCGCDCRVVVVTASLSRARGVCGGGWARARWARGHDDATSLLRARERVGQGGVEARARAGCARSGRDAVYVARARREPEGGGGPCASERRCEWWRWRWRARACRRSRAVARKGE